MASVPDKAKMKINIIFKVKRKKKKKTFFQEAKLVHPNWHKRKSNLKSRGGRKKKETYNVTTKKPFIFK